MADDPRRLDPEIEALFRATFGDGVRPANEAAAREFLERRFTEGPKLSTRLWGAGEAERESIIDYVRGQYRVGRGPGETPGYPPNRILENLRTWYQDGPSAGQRGDPTYVARRLAITESAFYMQALDNAVDAELEEAGMIDGYEILLAPEREDWDCDCPIHADGGPYETLEECPEPPFHPFCMCRRRPIILGQRQREKPRPLREELTDLAKGYAVNAGFNYVEGIARSLVIADDDPGWVRFVKSVALDAARSGAQRRIIERETPMWAALLARSAKNRAWGLAQDYVVTQLTDAARLVLTTKRGAAMQLMAQALARHYVLLGREYVRDLFRGRPVFHVGLRPRPALTREVIENAREIERIAAAARAAERGLPPPPRLGKAPKGMTPQDFDDKVRRILKEAIRDATPTEQGIFGTFRPKPGRKWSGDEVLRQVFGEEGIPFRPFIVAPDLTVWQKSGQLAIPPPSTLRVPSQRTPPPGVKGEPPSKALDLEFRVWPITAVLTGRLFAHEDAEEPEELVFPPGTILRAFAMQEEEGRWVIDFREMPSWENALPYDDDEILQWASTDLAARPDIGERIVEAWRATFPIPPLQVAQHMLFGLPVNLEGLSVRLHQGKVAITIRTDAFTATRNFRRLDAGIHVNHDGFRVVPERQGEGLATHFMVNSFYLYEALGFHRVATFASATGEDTGSYVWGRFGFQPTTRPEWRALQDSNIRPWLTQFRPYLSFEEASQIEQILADPDPRAIWRLAEHPWGKEALLGGTRRGWRGVIDLSDEEAMRRFNAYTRRLPLVFERRQEQRLGADIRTNQTFGPDGPADGSGGGPDPLEGLRLALEPLTHQDAAGMLLPATWQELTAGTPPDRIIRLLTDAHETGMGRTGFQSVSFLIVEHFDSGITEHLELQLVIDGSELGPAKIRLRRDLAVKGTAVDVAENTLRDARTTGETLAALQGARLIHQEIAAIGRVNVLAPSFEDMRRQLSLGLMPPLTPEGEIPEVLVDLMRRLAETATQDLLLAGDRVMIESWLIRPNVEGLQAIAMASRGPWLAPGDLADAFDQAVLYLALPRLDDPEPMRRLFEGHLTNDTGVLATVQDLAERIRATQRLPKWGEEVQGLIDGLFPKPEDDPRLVGHPTPAHLERIRERWARPSEPPTLDEFEAAFGDAQHIRVGGGPVDEQLAKWHRVMRLRPGDMVDYLYAILPPEIVGGYKWTWRIGTDVDTGISFELESATTKGLASFSMSRSIQSYEEDDDGNPIYQVSHQSFNVRRNSGAAKGLGRALMAFLFDVYRHIGVDRVEVGAGSTAGGYAWGRFGFMPEDTGTIESFAREFVEHVGGQSFEEWQNAALEEEFGTDDIDAYAAGKAVDAEVEYFQEELDEGEEPDMILLSLRRERAERQARAEFQEWIREHADEDDWLNSTLYDELGTDLEGDYGRLFWAMIDHREGMDFFAGRTWDGVFDFSDFGAVDRFDRYVEPYRPALPIMREAEAVLGERALTFALDAQLRQQVEARAAIGQRLPEPEPEERLSPFTRALLMHREMPSMLYPPDRIDRASFEYIGELMWWNRLVASGHAPAARELQTGAREALLGWQAITRTSIVDAHYELAQRLRLPIEYSLGPVWSITGSLSVDRGFARAQLVLNSRLPNPYFESTGATRTRENQHRDPNLRFADVAMQVQLGIDRVDSRPWATINLRAHGPAMLTPQQYVETIADTYRVLREIPELDEIRVVFQREDEHPYQWIPYGDPGRDQRIAVGRSIGAMFEWLGRAAPGSTAANRDAPYILGNKRVMVQLYLREKGVDEEFVARYMALAGSDRNDERWQSVQLLVREGHADVLGRVMLALPEDIQLRIDRDRADKLLPFVAMNRPLGQVGELPAITLTHRNEMERIWNQVRDEFGTRRIMPRQPRDEARLRADQRAGDVALWRSTEGGYWDDARAAATHRLLTGDVVASPEARRQVAETMFLLFNTPYAHDRIGIVGSDERVAANEGKIGITDTRIPDRLADADEAIVLYLQLAPDTHARQRAGTMRLARHFAPDGTTTRVDAELTHFGAYFADDRIGAWMSLASIHEGLTKIAATATGERRLHLRDVTDYQAIERLLRIGAEMVDDRQRTLLIGRMIAVVDHRIGKIDDMANAAELLGETPEGEQLRAEVAVASEALLRARRRLERIDELGLTHDLWPDFATTPVLRGLVREALGGTLAEFDDGSLGEDSRNLARSGVSFYLDLDERTLEKVQDQARRVSDFNYGEGAVMHIRPSARIETDNAWRLFPEPIEQISPEIVAERQRRPSMVSGVRSPVIDDVQMLGIKGIGDLLDFIQRDMRLPFVTMIGSHARVGSPATLDYEGVFQAVRRAYPAIEHTFGSMLLDALLLRGDVREFFSDGAGGWITQFQSLKKALWILIDVDSIRYDFEITHPGVPFSLVAPGGSDSYTERDLNEIRRADPAAPRLWDRQDRAVGRWHIAHDPLGMILHEAGHAVTVPAIYTLIDVGEGNAPTSDLTPRQRELARLFDAYTRELVRHPDGSQEAWDHYGQMVPSDYALLYLRDMHGYDTYLKHRRQPGQRRTTPETALKELLAEAFVGMTYDRDRFVAEYPEVAEMVELAIAETQTIHGVMPLDWPESRTIRPLNTGAVLEPHRGLVDSQAAEPTLSVLGVNLVDMHPNASSAALDSSFIPFFPASYWSAMQAGFVTLPPGQTGTMASADQPLQFHQLRDLGFLYMPFARDLLPADAFYSSVRPSLTPDAVLVVAVAHDHPTSPVLPPTPGHRLSRTEEHQAILRHFGAAVALVEHGNGVVTYAMSDDAQRLSDFHVEFRRRYLHRIEPITPFMRQNLPALSDRDDEDEEAQLEADEAAFDEHLQGLIDTYARELPWGTLYHGTVITNIGNIQTKGLMPQTGDLANIAWQEWPGQELPGAVFFAQERFGMRVDDDDRPIFMVLEAIRFHISVLKGDGDPLKDRFEVTLHDLLMYGALVAVTDFDPEQVFERIRVSYHELKAHDHSKGDLIGVADLTGRRIFDDLERFQQMPHFELGDIISLQPVPVAQILTGDALLAFLLADDDRRRIVNDIFGPGALDEALHNMFAIWREERVAQPPTLTPENLEAFRDRDDWSPDEIDLMSRVGMVREAIENEGFEMPRRLVDTGIGPALYRADVREGARVIELKDLIHREYLRSRLDGPSFDKTPLGYDPFHSLTQLAARLGYQAVDLGFAYAVLDGRVDPGEDDAVAIISGPRGRLERIRIQNSDVAFRYISFGGRTS